jgi:RNA polymerase sigma-70 factor (ECF subfamily)
MVESNKTRDLELIKRFKSGDESAYEELVNLYASKAYQISFGLISNRLDSEEVVQDAFIKVHSNLEKFRGDSSFSTWLYRIITNLSRNKYHWNRRRGRDVNVSISDRGPYADDIKGDMEIPDNDLKPDVLLERMETESTLIEAIKKLPEKLREIVILRHLEEMTYAEMADLLGCELGTIKSRLARAREALKIKFAEAAG